MLSIENPTPDPPCPLEISQLKRTSDERASDEVPLQEVDLSKSGLDDNNPLPKFCIRDYVFGARSKDIETNWPFSRKNFQLCLKHGLKDLLPPFWPIDSVRNQSIKKCTVEKTSSFVEETNICHSNGEPSGTSNDFVSMPADGAFITCVAVETNSSSKASGQKLETLSPPASPTSESTSQHPVKKCRLIARGFNGADPSLNDDTTANCAAFLEPMASKVCPVCKTFSSSSNTTLNAHIDQCLSVESTTKWTADSRVIKHRIKPRKTRLMVDIYATASRCTLEELDTRNGTNWAMKSSLPTQENMECVEGEKKRLLPVDFKDKGDEGAVYIDAKGKKLRILSKFNDTSSVPKIEAGPRPHKPFRSSGSKLFSTYKKKHNAKKHHKYPKLASRSKKFWSSKPCNAEVPADLERNSALGESFKRDPFKAQEKIKHNDLGTIKKWACSKRTSPLKRCNLKEGFWQEFPDEGGQTSFGDSYMQKSRVQKAPKSSDCPFSLPENSKRIDNSSFQAAINECNEQPPLRKRVGFSSFGSQSGNMKRFVEPMNHNVKQLRKDSTPVDESCKHFANYRENYVPSPGKKPVEINAGPAKNGYQDVCSDLSRSPLPFSSKATRFSSLRRHLSVNRSSVPDSKWNKKCSTSKNSEVHCMAEFNKELVALPSEVAESYDSMEKSARNKSRIEQINGKVSFGRCSVLKTRKKGGTLHISRAELSKALKSPSGHHNHDVVNNISSYARVVGDSSDTFDDMESDKEGLQSHREHVVIRTSSGVDAGRSLLSEPLSPKFHKMASPSNTLAGSFQTVVFKSSFRRAETLSSPPDPSLDGERETLCMDEVGNSMIAENTQLGAEMDSKDGQGNYYSVVDPIPIPGPPGSFLPSPGRMGSEDLQGNSSLTTSRLQSSEDHHDLIDGDSSDSPISAMSTISNTTILRSDSKSSGRLSVEPLVAQDEIRSGFSGGDHEAVSENTAPIQQLASVLAERISLDELEVGKIVPVKGPNNFRNDQPCCCSRKVGTSQVVSVNYQESQLLSRQIVGSLPLSATGKQLNCDPKRRNSVPEVISSNNIPSSGSEQVVPPITKVAEGPVAVKVSVDCALESSVHGDCDSVSPSASNPVLRLMGKNLMVVNKDETAYQQFRPRFQRLSGESPHNVQNEDFGSLHHMVHQHPLFSVESQYNAGFEVSLLNSFGGHVPTKTPQTPSQSPLSFYPSKHGGGGFTASLEPHDQNRSRSRLYPPFAYNAEKVVTSLDIGHRNADSTINPAKEVIVIDDTTEREADSLTDEAYLERRVNSAGISNPTATNYNSRPVNPFYSYQPQQGSSSLPVLPSAGFQVPPHIRGNAASPIKWNCTSEKNSAILPSSDPLTASSSSSTAHLRSSLCHSPSFS